MIEAEWISHADPQAMLQFKGPGSRLPPARTAQLLLHPGAAS